MQPEPSVPQEPQVPASEPMAKLRPPRKPIGKIVLLILLLLAVVGLGIWSFQANVTLKAAKQSLAVTQSKHDALNARTEKLTSDLGQTNTELEQVNAELAKTNEALKTAKAELAAVNSKVPGLKSKIEKAAKYVEVLRGAFEDEDNVFITLVKVIAIKDEKLDDLWSDYLKGFSSSSLVKFVTYLISTTVDILKK